MRQTSPPIVGALGSAELLYTHTSLAAGAVSRESTLAVVDNLLVRKVARQRHHVVRNVSVPSYSKPYSQRR